MLKQLLGILALSILLFTACEQKKTPVKEDPLSQLSEFTQRGGLPNTFYKIQNQRQVKIAYIGGSITQASNGWRDLTFSWFRLNFPQTAFYQINAAIGGTGSDLGVFRMERDVLQHEPDLIFIEFSVNDGGSREKVLAAMEGIVRQVRKNNPKTDICFVYTAAEMHVRDLVEGKLRVSAAASEELAAHYQIPTIHMGIEVARLYQQGKLTLVADPEENANTIVFTRDKTHPLSESGHPIYGAVVAKYLEEMRSQPADVEYSLPDPYVDYQWEEAQMVEVSETQLIGEWKELPDENEIKKGVREFMPHVFQASPGAVMKFRFDGSVLGFYDVIGPKVSVIEITVDGEKQEKVRFDQWCNNYRKTSFFIKDLEPGLHSIEIRVLDKQLDKAEILKKKNVTMDDPSRFNGKYWFPASILVVGKIIN
tara:strand:- start:1361 stop:2629 length:1269 start_codon:yes stop_codon:yes gene_type:complete